jgi:hypothetical protein
VQFIVGTGDNVYSFGVSHAKDPLFAEVFERVFDTDQAFTQLPWLKTLGNHDCRGNTEAQVEVSTIPSATTGRLGCRLTMHHHHHHGQYSQYNRRWLLPSKAYRATILFPDVIPIEIFVLDTCPLVCGDLNKVCVAMPRHMSAMTTGVLTCANRIGTDRIGGLCQSGRLQGV